MWYSFHSQHYLYSNNIIPPNSAHRRGILLLSHHFYLASQDSPSAVGDMDLLHHVQTFWNQSIHSFIDHIPLAARVSDSKSSLRELWHQQLTMLQIKNEQIEFVLKSHVEAFDIGELVRYILIVGDVQRPLFVRPGWYAQKMVISLDDFDSLVQQPRRNPKLNPIFPLASPLDVDPRRPPLVVFETFPTTVDVLEFRTIYLFFDELMTFVRSLRRVYDRCIIVWVLPAGSESLEPELKLLFQFLALQHLVTRMGVLVLPALPDAGVAGMLSSQLSMLYNQAQSFYNHHPPRKVSAAKNENEVVRRLSVINAYLRPVFESEGSFSLFDTLHSQRNQFHNRTQQSLHATCVPLLNTRKYDVDCMPVLGKLYPLLITGLGGTGTHFLADALQELGFDVSHESLGVQGSVVS
jgi:hypothetical protein